MILPNITLVMIDNERTKIKADMSIVGNDKWNKEILVEHNYYKLLKGLMQYYNNSTEKIQDCFLFLSAEEREFMLSGLTPIEQERIFGSEESLMGSDDPE